MPKQRKTERDSQCELTASPAKRARANRMTDQIAPDFPPGVARPALRALAAAGYSSVRQLADVPDDKLLQLHGMGPKALRAIRDALAAVGKRRT